jgi:hypothetical protein
MSAMTRRRFLTGAAAAVAALAVGTSTRVARATHTSMTVSTTTRAARIGVSIGAADLMYRGAAWRDARLDEAVHLGANWLRTDANWAWIEGTRGTWSWAELDGLVDACAARHLRPLLVLGTLPTWARPAETPETHGPTTQSQRDGFAAFCNRVATRYRGRVVHYEVWNEPNLPQFWSSPSTDSYAKLLKAAYPRIKAGDPGARVLAGGVGWGSTIDTVTWYRDLYARGCKPYFDIANTHPYQDPYWSRQGTWDSGELYHAAHIRHVMNQNGDSATPLWGSEFGAPSSGDNSLTEDQHARSLVGGRDLWFEREPNSVLFLYTMRDRTVYGGAEREDHFGLTRADGIPKPFHDEMRNWILA